MDKSPEYWIAWIISDYTPFVFNGRSYFLSTPGREFRFLSERVYQDSYRKSINEGLLTDQDKDALLVKYNLWNPDQQALLDKLISEVDDIKVNIFESYVDAGRRKALKQALVDTNTYIQGLLKTRSSLDNYCARSIAQFARQHFLLGSSIFVRKNKPLYKNDEWWYVKNDDIVYSLYNTLNEYTLDETDYRELSKTAQWRNTYVAKSNIFGRPAADLSLPQRQLLMWTKMYDSVYKSSDCPSEEIVNDNDAIDGWFIVQRRKREKETNQHSIESNLPDKIRNSEEIYIMCDPTSAEKVMECNDHEAKLRWQSRMKQIKKEGTVSDYNLTDRKRELQRQIHERNLYV